MSNNNFDDGLRRMSIANKMRQQLETNLNIIHKKYNEGESSCSFTYRDNSEMSAEEQIEQFTNIFGDNPRLTFHKETYADGNTILSVKFNKV